MKLKNYLLIAVLSLGFLTIEAQEDGLRINDKIANEWLVAIEGDTTTAGDFWYLFNKNNFDKTVPNIDSLNKYRALYSKFLLKVKDASDRGLDTTKKFIKEFNGYKNQLAESYLKDKTVTKQLVKESYDRSLIDIEASHVLINIKLHALPNDTLEAYNKALNVQTLARSGKDFGALAKKYSQDPSAQSNKGYLGFFPAFKMVYPFESGAYKTKTGEISEIVRTRYGYHVLKVHSKRKSIGEIKVAHILMIVKEEMDEKGKEVAKQKIDEVYGKLKAGDSFETLAQQFSEDQQTRGTGGELPWFGAGKFVPEFENAAFALTEKASLSKPVKTKYGWHIIKLIELKKVLSFAKMEATLKSKVARSDRAEKSESAVLNNIKKEYGFTEKFPWKKNRHGINSFFQYCDTTLLAGNWAVTTNATLKAKMFSFAGKTYNQSDFAKYLTEKLAPRKGGEYKHLVNYSYDEWIKTILLDHEKLQLGRKYPDYLRLLKEYRDGIILFELTDQMVWSKAISDTSGLKSFHQKHAANWKWDNRMDGVIYKCKDAPTVQLVKKYLDSGKDDVYILENVNKNSQLNVRVEAGVYQRKSRPEIGDLKFAVGVSDISTEKDVFTVLKINKVLLSENKDLKEVKGLVTAKYQDFLMEEWLKTLEGKYKMEYNDKVYNQLIH